ncbi:MAG: DUF7518 family protein [Halobacteriota archaeon]
MPGNRVDQLETTVQELRATVSGLNEELVAVKRRLRELESDDAAEAQTTGVDFDDGEIIIS